MQCNQVPAIDLHSSFVSSTWGPGSHQSPWGVSLSGRSGLAQVWSNSRGILGSILFFEPWWKMRESSKPKTNIPTPVTIGWENQYNWPHLLGIMECKDGMVWGNLPTKLGVRENKGWIVLFKVGPTRTLTHLPTSAPTCYFSVKNATFSFGYNLVHLECYSAPPSQFWVIYFKPLLHDQE